jgi:serine/threonine-protein kinase HipA
MSSFAQVSKLQVNYCSQGEPISVGHLALINRKIYFEYTASFLEFGLELSPFKLPLRPGVQSCEELVFEGLFGLFNDSLPDGWGRLLLDRKLFTMGINPATLTPLDRLRFVGTGGMGALQYHPAHLEPVVKLAQIELDRLAEECFVLS